MRVAVVGGGISGLVAARDLAVGHDVVLFEAASGLGGKVATARLRGRPVDLGPDAFITRTPAALELCFELGLGDELLAPSSNRVALYVRGALRALPDHLVLGVPTDLGSLWRTGAVTPIAVLRAASDLLRSNEVLSRAAVAAAQRGGADPSVAEVFGRRLGRSVLTNLLDPLLGGINASDVAGLSLVASAPQLATRVAGHRSVLRALRAEPPTFGERPSGPPFLGLEGGMTDLIDALGASAASRGVDLRVGAAVARVARHDGGLALRGDFGVDRFDAAVLATPTYVTSELLADLDADLAEELAAVPYASLVTCCLAFRSGAIPASTSARLAELVEGSGALPGSGLLVPRDGRRVLSAITFTSTKWPRSANAQEVVLRCFAGRHGDERPLRMDDAALVAALREDLREVLGIEDAPLEALVQRWPRAIPQFVTGHLARLCRIEDRLAELPELALCGSAYGGIGLPSCVSNAKAAAERVRAALAA